MATGQPLVEQRRTCCDDIIVQRPVGVLVDGPIRSQFAERGSCPVPVGPPLGKFGEVPQLGNVIESAPSVTPSSLKAYRDEPSSGRTTPSAIQAVRNLFFPW